MFYAVTFGCSFKSIHSHDDNTRNVRVLRRVQRVLVLFGIYSTGEGLPLPLVRWCHGNLSSYVWRQVHRLIVALLSTLEGIANLTPEWLMERLLD